MNKLVVTALTAALLSTGASFAQDSGVSENVLTTVQIVVEYPKFAELRFVQDMVEELKAAGYTYLEISRTFLGRARIIAYSATEMREVVIHPVTGEILRDLTQSYAGPIPTNANAYSEDNELSDGSGGGSGSSVGGSGGSSGGSGGGSGGISGGEGGGGRN